MTAKILPAAAGWQWWKSAFGLLLRAPKSVLLYPMLFALGFCAVLIAVFLVVFLVVSLLGSLLDFPEQTVTIVVRLLMLVFAMAIAPALILGFMSIFRSADCGESLSVAAFMQPFRERLLPLAVAGLLIDGFAIIAQFLVIAVNGLGIDELWAMYTGDIFDLSSVEASSAEGIGLPLFNLLIIAVVMMLKLYSYFLIGWHDRPVISAFKESFTAALKNWAPSLVCSLVCLVGLIVVTTVVTIVGAIVGASVLPFLAAILLWLIPKWILLPVCIAGAIVFAAVVTALLYGVWYYSYKTVFGEQEPTPEQKAYQ
jgi:hypothetical protein